jgi:hypothetical protein
LEKFPRYGGENSKSSDFAATIINQFAGADTQNVFTSGGFRSILLKNSKNLRACFSAESQSIPSSQQHLLYRLTNSPVGRDL